MELYSDGNPVFWIVFACLDIFFHIVVYEGFPKPLNCFLFDQPLNCFPSENILAISENPADKSSILVLKKLPGCAIIFHAAGMWLSLVERCVRDAKAAGSNPVIPTR